jgi:hypothetical protein
MYQIHEILKTIVRNTADSSIDGENHFSIVSIGISLY